jgi:hypothetical protein
MRITAQVHWRIRTVGLRAIGGCDQAQERSVIAGQVDEQTDDMRFKSVMQYVFSVIQYIYIYIYIYIHLALRHDGQHAVARIALQRRLRVYVIA